MFSLIRLYFIFVEWYVYIEKSFFFFFQAHLWIVTMNELRTGVKLKKTNFTKTPIEYALTPYEMLVSHLDSRRIMIQSFNIVGKNLKTYLMILPTDG